MQHTIIDDQDIDNFLNYFNRKIDDSSNQLFLDRERRRILKSWSDVQACPGSGKTTLVAVKLLILANKLPLSDAGVCVLTHTNVAKHEILSKIRHSPAGYRLTKYPNFIGTIQEFVNRFLAVPYLRSIDRKPTRIDDDSCVTLMHGLVTYGTQQYLDRKRASLFDLKISHQTGKASIPGFKKQSESKTYKDLLKVLKERIRRGYFFYSEMYCFAQRSLENNNGMLSAIRKRFPYVLIDEMQDTQDFQDELIGAIFSDCDVSVQRLGDPDQAIFDNMGGSSPNQTFNSNHNLVPLKSTHRFTSSIAKKIHGLSVTDIGQLESLKCAEDHNMPHTIFLYTDSTKNMVLEKFCELIDTIDPNRLMGSVKAVGATEGTGGYISSYWTSYDKNKSIKNPKPQLFIDAVSRCWWDFEQESGQQYSLLVQCILDLLKRSKIFNQNVTPNRFHTHTSLTNFLRESNKYEEFRTLLTSWILNGAGNEVKWNEDCARLMSLFDISSDNTDATDYLTYSRSDNNASNIETTPKANIYRASSGREVEVSTIHSVKGETHDATLVLETKNHQFDLGVLVNRLSLTESSKLKGVRKIKFARQVYVAASRPRKLLCMAIHQNHVQSKHREALETNGWRIQLL
ncbi:UvrD-helicase domain-containing protein [Idiomarina seosinensis]|uniref:UvrD-like helicase ATP-binding domain-containing protein n=1 Tax=Idiomarina seosinensis TaxID=281739 RepID=A0A432ZJ19_9GAMM|nr:UvrD-helicase domain-containing protein [Idiomarina seosinensis]RUO77884.1 hypothetical protein CWI81_05225 [Idiomarina seosinensis]